MPWAPKETVIVPIDFSERSFVAIDVAREIVSKPSGLHIVHVVSTPYLFDPVSVLAQLDHSNTYHQTADAIRQHLNEKYKDAQVNVFFGDPGTEIAAFAERVNADLVVIPSHGRAGLARVLLGSVAQRVVQLAHCPVLVLRG